ncbi:MAG: afuA [Devosia sp.]|nr:afuA [Devosia sp.]
MKTTLGIRFDTLALTAMFSLALAGAATAQTALETLEAAAKAEGSVLVYTSVQDADMEAKVAAFEAVYPEIRVDYIRLPSSQVFTRFVGESDAGVTQADLLATGSSALYQSRPELFIPIGAENLPSLTEVPAIIEPLNDRYQVFVNDVQLVTYNTDTVSDADLAEHLASWEDLADPRWAGRIALVDPRNSANQVSFLLNMQRLYGDEWFTRFMANTPEIVGTASAASQQVAAGAYDILVPTVPSQSGALRAQGAPIGLYTPAGLNHVTAAGVAVTAGASHPNAALLFANWLLTPAAQALQCTFGGIPNIETTAAECEKLLPAEYDLARDVIPEAEANHVFGLVGLQP